MSERAEVRSIREGELQLWIRPRNRGPLKVGGGELRSSNIPGVYLRWLEGRGNPIQGTTEVRTRIRKSRLLFS